MGKTHRHPLIVLRSFLICFACVSATGSTWAQIVGRWRSLETSRGGIGAMYEFHPNGVVDYSPGAVVDLPWRIEANELVLPSETLNGPERRPTVKWLDPNKFQLIDHGVLTAELARVKNTSSADGPILGEWTGIRDMAGRKLEMRWFFYAEGKSLFLLPFGVQHGQYIIKGSTLTIQVQGQSPRDLRFEAKDNILTLTKADGSEESRFAHY